MTSTHDSALLEAWESACRQSWPHRAAALLALTGDGAVRDRSLADSERQLLQWRARQFGPRLACIADCRHCGAPFEFELDARDLTAEPASLPLSLKDRDYHIALRRPSLDDCIAMAETHDAARAYELLLQRCVAARGSDGRPIDAKDLPAECLQAIDEHWAVAEAAEAIDLALVCPNCERPASTRLDVTAFCWAEVERHAARVLHEVHRLAARYGWREADILAMSRQRRAAYLELALP